MGTKITDSSKISKDQLISKIKKIAANEEFEMDAYFFCGYPSRMPNKKLLNACQKYLETASDAQPNKDAAANLIAELEAVAANSGAAVKLDGNLADIEEVLTYKELLTN